MQSQQHPPPPVRRRQSHSSIRRRRSSKIDSNEKITTNTTTRKYLLDDPSIRSLSSSSSSSSDDENDNIIININKTNIIPSTRRTTSSSTTTEKKQQSKSSSSLTAATTASAIVSTPSSSERGLTKSVSRRRLSSNKSNNFPIIVDHSSVVTRTSSSSFNKPQLIPRMESFRKASSPSSTASTVVSNSDSHSTGSHSRSTGSSSSSSNKNSPTGIQFFKLLDIDPSKSKHKLDEETFLELITNEPSLCSNKYSNIHVCNGDTVYPLHMICALGASLTTIKLCYKAYAEAIDYVSPLREMTCLHYAVLYTRASLDVIQFLMKKEPDAIKTTTKKLHTPLHLACMCPASFKLYNPEVIMLLTELSDKQYLVEQDKFGRTPLHIACGVSDPSLAVVEDLTEVNSNACIVQCYQYKTTPLHIACSNVNISNENHVIVDIIKDLLRSNYEATKMKDIDEQLPIFVAVTNNACYKVIKMLVKKFPECLEMKDRHCNNITLHELAKQKKMNQEIIDFLNPYEEE